MRPSLPAVGVGTEAGLSCPGGPPPQSFLVSPPGPFLPQDTGDFPETEGRAGGGCMGPGSRQGLGAGGGTGELRAAHSTRDTYCTQLTHHAHAVCTHTPGSTHHTYFHTHHTDAKQHTPCTRMPHSTLYTHHTPHASHIHQEHTLCTHTPHMLPYPPHTRTTQHTHTPCTQYTTHPTRVPHNIHSNRP